MIRAGRLNRIVAIWNPPVTATGYGEFTTTPTFSSSTWSKVCLAWAEILDMGASETPDENGARAYVTTKQITIRTNPKVTAGLCSASAIVHGTRVYYVQDYKDPWGRGEEIMILAVERRAGA